MKNVLSVDLEDWFCVHNLSQVIDREQWNTYEFRVEQNTLRLLNIFDKHQVKATFFVLCWIAEKLPDLIKEIAKRNHEIASHGYSHQLLTHMTPSEFEDDLEKSLNAIQQCGIKQNIIGFRAPSFTIVNKTKWALEILEKYHLKYDSSVFPINYHPDYGMPDAPLHPYKITDSLYEVPLSCIDLCKLRIPCSGGGYFRLFPYQFTKYCIKKCNAAGRPIIFYLHPWEIDHQQPRISLPMLKKFRHYHGLKHTENKLEKLLQDFEFSTIKDMLGLH